MELFTDASTGKVATPTQLFAGIQSEVVWPRNFALTSVAEARDLLKMYYSPVKMVDHLVVFFLSEDHDVLAFQSVFVPFHDLKLVRAGQLMTHASCYGAKRIFFVRVLGDETSDSHREDDFYPYLQRLAGEEFRANFAVVDLKESGTERYKLDAELNTQFYIKSGEVADKFAVTRQATVLSLARLEREQALPNASAITKFVEMHVAPILGASIHVLLMTDNSYLMHCVQPIATLEALIEEATTIFTTADRLKAKNMILVLADTNQSHAQIPDNYLRIIKQVFGVGMRALTYVSATPAATQVISKTSL